MQGSVKDAENFPFVVIGNKKDKESERKVNFSQLGQRNEGPTVVQESWEHSIL